jgi:hypothetical protein
MSEWITILVLIAGFVGSGSGAVQATNYRSEVRTNCR